MKKFLWIFLLVIMPALVLIGCNNHHIANNNIHVTFTGLTAAGDSTATTSALTLAFNRNITSLTIDDIAISGSGVGEIEKTYLTHNDTGVYTLGLRGITNSGSLTVTVTKRRFTIEPPSRDVAVFYVESNNLPT